MQINVSGQRVLGFGVERRLWVMEDAQYASIMRTVQLILAAAILTIHFTLSTAYQSRLEYH